MVSGTSASLCWILLSVCFTVSCEGLVNITAKPGETVTLPCQAPRNTTVQVVEWIRRDLNNPTLCVYRDSKWENSDSSFKDRVQLNNDLVKNGNVSLILKNVTINDAGAYECDVKLRESKRRKRDVDLKPIVYLIVGNSGLVNITAEPGDTVTLPCQAPKNTTVQVVEWIRRDLDNPTLCVYRDGKWENSDSSFKDRVQMNNDLVKNGNVSLILKNVTISDTGAYECDVKLRESKRRKRAVDLKPIVYLIVGNSGDGAKPKENGGHENGGQKNGGHENGGNFHGLGIGLGALVVLFVIGGVVVFALKRKGFIKVKSDDDSALK